MCLFLKKLINSSKSGTIFYLFTKPRTFNIYKLARTQELFETFL